MKLKLCSFLCAILICFLAPSFAQSVKLSNASVEKNSPLNKIFFDYKLVKIEYNQLKAAMSSRGNQHFIHLQSEDIDWNLEMYEHDVHTGDYVLRLGTEHGIETLRRKPANTPMVGYLKSPRGGQAILVVSENYIAGMVEQGGAQFFIEPANGIDPSLSSDYLIIYDIGSVIQNTEIDCGYELYKKNLEHFEETGSQIQNTQRNHCLQVEIAISNDFTVFQKRGSEAAVENWNTTVLTLMQTNYDDEFAHGLEFVQSASFVALSAGSDPWNGINNIDAQLTKHRDWGNGGGYGAIYDVATNWTTKYKTGAVGLAWVGVICSNLRYNVCSDYGGSNGCLKQLQAHEVGHNFAANHDGGGQPFIMAPAVNCVNAWSAQSISSVNNHVNSRSCLSICSGGSPPEVDFFANPTEACVPFVVQFTDLSTNDPTAWQWTFPGGTPSSSTLKNPTVTYKSYGEFDVTLKASNTYGNNTVTFKKYIFAKDKPVANFSKVIIQRTVYFTNLTLYGGAFEWDFGDGETSNDIDPIHEYLDDGVYDVVLRAENECGVHEMKMTITIVTTPIALFSADTTKGCATLKVKYINLSSKNVTSWKWDFPGGTPSTSTLFEPTVEYKNPGDFDVRLEAKNSKYKAIAEKLKFINVDSTPVAGFDTTSNSNTVHFTSKSKYAKTWKWDFGDGNTSTELNPNHTYNPGSYIAKLTVNNPCGISEFTRQIVIGSKILTAGFSADKRKGCTPFEVQFTNTSIAAVSYLWSFPGGDPSSSTDQNPKVTYSVPGKYDVSLTAYNGIDSILNSQTNLIEVQTLPEAGYIFSITGSTVFFTNQSKYGTSQTWDFGDGNTSTESSPNHQYTAEGDYTVTIITTNECGSDTLNQLIAVFLIPKLDFTSDTTFICGAGYVQFISKTSSDVKTWSWNFDGGTPQASNEKHPLVYYNKKGTYSVKLAVANSNGENELVKQSYIKVISAVHCPDTMYIKTEMEIAGNKPVEAMKIGVSEIPEIFPNPFNGMLSLRGASESEHINVRILDVLGKEIYSEQIEVINGQYFRNWNFDYLQEGTYLINIYHSKNNILKTIFLSR